MLFFNSINGDMQFTPRCGTTYYFAVAQKEDVAFDASLARLDKQRKMMLRRILTTRDVRRHARNECVGKQRARACARTEEDPIGGHVAWLREASADKQVLHKQRG